HDGARSGGRRGRRGGESPRWRSWARRLKGLASKHADCRTSPGAHGKTASPSSWVERKEMAHKLDILRRLPLTERALQVHRRHMEELIHQAHAERLESASLALFEWANPGQGFVEFLATRRLSPLAQRHNGRGGLTGRQPLVKMPQLTPDQILRHQSLLLACAAVRCDDVFQSVHIIKENIFQCMDGWINIAWHGNIDKEHGAMLAHPHYFLDHRFLDDRLWRAGRTEHNIRLHQILWELLPEKSFGLECLRQLFGTLRRAI